MKSIHWALLLYLFFSCGSASHTSFLKTSAHLKAVNIVVDNQIKKQSWAHFLNALPIINKPVLNFRGKPVDDNEKSWGIIPYDVGKSDLQQCADVLMRLRAEYLFEQRRFSEIGFHFVSGYYYSWTDYCKGKMPVKQGRGVKMVQSDISEKTHASLRKYLDIVYTYSSTISLAKELKNATEFEIGTVVIHPGSPGHCLIIIDESKDPEGNKVFKLAEGYTPAQSIYVLRNLSKKERSPWYRLSKGIIETTSYRFTTYQLKKFE